MVKFTNGRCHILRDMIFALSNWVHRVVTKVNIGGRRPMNRDEYRHLIGYRLSSPSLAHKSALYPFVNNKYEYGFPQTVFPVLSPFQDRLCITDAILTTKKLIKYTYRTSHESNVYIMALVNGKSYLTRLIGRACA